MDIIPVRKKLEKTNKNKTIRGITFDKFNLLSFIFIIVLNS